MHIQAELRPILLRRMKEDVENLPEKEEVVVWVQLTHQQRQYYKALYSNQVMQRWIHPDSLYIPAAAAALR